MSGMNEWNETKVMLHELEQLFLREDDVNDIIDVLKMKDEVSKHSELKLNDAKEIIKG